MGLLTIKRFTMRHILSILFLAAVGLQASGQTIRSRETLATDSLAHTRTSEQPHRTLTVN